MPHVKRDPLAPRIRKDRGRPATLLGPCRKCGANDRFSSGYGGCRPCRASPENRAREKEKRDRPEAKARQKAWRESDRGRLLDKTYLLQRHYGLTHDQYLAMIRSQRKRCASCRDRFTGEGRASKSPHVDHDHKTGRVRGILCRECNIAEGLLRSIKRVDSLAAYLRRAVM